MNIHRRLFLAMSGAVLGGLALGRRSISACTYGGTTVHGYTNYPDRVVVDAWDTYADYAAGRPSRPVGCPRDPKPTVWRHVALRGDDFKSVWAVVDGLGCYLAQCGDGPWRHWPLGGQVHSDSLARTTYRLDELTADRIHEEERCAFLGVGPDLFGGSFQMGVIPLDESFEFRTVTVGRDGMVFLARRGAAEPWRHWIGTSPEWRGRAWVTLGRAESDLTDEDLRLAQWEHAQRQLEKQT